MAPFGALLRCPRWRWLACPRWRGLPRQWRACLVSPVSKAMRPPSASARRLRCAPGVESLASAPRWPTPACPRGRRRLRRRSARWTSGSPYSPTGGRESGGDSNRGRHKSGETRRKGARVPLNTKAYTLQPTTYIVNLRASSRVVVAVPLCTRLPLALGVWGLGFGV